jgi:F0F1-type ATP synthase assembly protein I
LRVPFCAEDRGVSQVFIPITKKQVPMERQQLIQLGTALVIGIIIGLGIGFMLWHGAGASGTCAVPLGTAG